MKICPDCRNPVSSLLFLDGKAAPEPYCERCCKSVAPIEKPIVATKVAVLA